jgi:hypothetical protein
LNFHKILIVLAAKMVLIATKSVAGALTQKHQALSGTPPRDFPGLPSGKSSGGGRV